MSSQAWAEILSPLIGVVLTITYRLVDKYLPDEDGKHPLPSSVPRSDGPTSATDG